MRARADNDGEPFDDAQVDRMLATLAAILSLPDVAADIEHQADFAFGRFNSQLQTGRINEELTARIGAYLDELKEERLDYRTWWDGHSRPDADVVAADGPIAAEWGVFEWRKIYVLDEEGVIRHVDKRGGALIAAVDELLLKKRMREYEAQRRPQRSRSTPTVRRTRGPNRGTVRTEGGDGPRARAEPIVGVANRGIHCRRGTRSVA